MQTGQTERQTLHKSQVPHLKKYRFSRIEKRLRSPGITLECTAGLSAKTRTNLEVVLQIPQKNAAHTLLASRTPDDDTQMFDARDLPAIVLLIPGFLVPPMVALKRSFLVLLPRNYDHLSWSWLVLVALVESCLPLATVVVAFPLFGIARFARPELLHGSLPNMVFLAMLYLLGCWIHYWLPVLTPGAWRPVLGRSMVLGSVPVIAFCLAWQGVGALVH